jgi:hypothetical protein
MAEKEGPSAHFGTIIGATFAILIVTMMLTMTLVAANKETHYSAYVTDAPEEKDQLAQVTDMRNTLGPGAGNDGYKIRNTLSTPMLVNDWEEPHRTMLVIAGAEKPIDETEATAIHDFVTELGGKVIVATDGTNANRLAEKFGVTFFGEPLLDEDQNWRTYDDDGNPSAENPTNVWGISSIRTDIQSNEQLGVNPIGCTTEMLNEGSDALDDCRIPVMFKAPTAMRWESVETDDPNHDDYQRRDVSVLAMASVSACIDRIGTQSCDEFQNPLSNLSLILRIDYPSIEVFDERRIADSDGSSYGSLDATGSIVFISDEEALSNRFWTAARAADTDVKSDCDMESTSCWQRHLAGDNAWKGNEVYFSGLIRDMMEFDNEMLPYSIRLKADEFRIVFDESRHVTSALANPFTETMSTIVLLTSDDFLKWLIVLNLLLLLLVAIMVVPEKENWRHVFDLTRFRERPNKIDTSTYKQRMREALMTKVRIFYDLTRDEMAVKTPAEVQSMIGDPRLVELAYSQNVSYSPEKQRELLQTIRRWGKN